MEKSNERIREAFENKEVLKAKVVNVLTGGLSVIVDETKIFIPAALYLILMRKIFLSMQDRRLSLLSASLTKKRRSLVIESSFCCREEEETGRAFCKNSCWRYCRRCC